MYESGLSKPARILFLIIVVLLAYVLIMTSGCYSKCPCSEAHAAEPTVIETDAGVQHSFF